MIVKLNRFQRIAIIISAAVIGIIQTVAILDNFNSGDGVSGIGWIAGYLTSGALILVAINGTNDNTKKKETSLEQLLDKMVNMALSLSIAIYERSKDECKNTNNLFSDEYKKIHASKISFAIIFSLLIKDKDKTREYIAKHMLGVLYKLMKESNFYKNEYEYDDADVIIMSEIESMEEVALYLSGRSEDDIHKTQLTHFIDDTMRVFDVGSDFMRKEYMDSYCSQILVQINNLFPIK